jgi:hypothetical protein
MLGLGFGLELGTKVVMMIKLLTLTLILTLTSDLYNDKVLEPFHPYDVALMFLSGLGLELELGIRRSFIRVSVNNW